MTRDYSISVAMATYNGEKYIKDQLESILEQLNDQDEIILSDDGSSDKTIDIVKSLNDKRIKIIEGPKKGVIKNFENAISNCSGKYIFLSDQDDVWEKNKVQRILEIFEKEKCNLIVHNASIVDNTMKEVPPFTTFEWRKSKKGIFKNIYKNSYIGCCMAFEPVLLNKIIPIPNDIEMHDQWIGLISEKYGKSYFLDEKLIKYRRHDSNVSQMKHNSIGKMIKSRILFIKNISRR